MSKAYVDDIGTQLYFDCIEDISGGNAFKINVFRPDGTSTVWVGSLYGTTKILYTVKAEDWIDPGTYYYNPFVEYASGNKWYGDTYEHEVYALGE